MAKKHNYELSNKNDNKKVIKIKFCPKCKSTDVYYIFGFGNLFGILPKMKCNKCGYSLTEFPIAVIDRKELNKRKIKKKMKVLKK